jgi:hypothetical protein
MDDGTGLVTLPDSGLFPRVRLIEPTVHGYVIAAFEIDHRPPIGFMFESGKKRTAIAALKAVAAELRHDAGVVEAAVFKTLLQPPGRGALLDKRPQVPVARFDLVLLVETESVEIAEALVAEARLHAAIAAIERDATRSMVVALRNERRMGPVDHVRDGVFLFNYFYADRLAQNLAVWEYTAGWFADQTGLDNSTLLIPEARQDCPYTVINHCRWDGLGAIVPALLFKPSFRSYVLKHFEANDTAAIPILYRLA